MAAVQGATWRRNVQYHTALRRDALPASQLYLCSEADQLIRCQTVLDHVSAREKLVQKPTARNRATGTSEHTRSKLSRDGDGPRIVQCKVWRDSPHVGHMQKHRSEYVAAIAKFLSAERKARAQQANARSVSGKHHHRDQESQN